MHTSVEGTQTDNSAKRNMLNVPENIKVTKNKNTSEISSAGGKITVNEIKEPTSKEDDKLASGDCNIKVSSAIDNLGTCFLKSLDSDFVPFNIPDNATKTLENLEKSPTNPSKNVAFCEGDTEANSDLVAKLKTNKKVAHLNKITTNKNIEYKESGDTTADLNLESKLTFDTDSNKTESTKSLENVDKKEEIANRTIKKKPLSAREILKKSIEIRGKRLEKIAVSQSLEEVASKVNVLDGKLDAKEDNNIIVVENIVKVTSSDEEKPSETKNFGLNTSQNIEGGDRNVLEVNTVEREIVEENGGTKNTEFLGESVVEVNGSIGESDVNVVKQNFHDNFEKHSGEKSLETTFATRNFIENTDKIVENEPESSGRSKSRKYFPNLVENVSSSPQGEDIMNCREEDSTSSQTRRLRKRTAPYQSCSSGHSDENVQEENGEKISSGGKQLKKASKGRRKTAMKVDSKRNFDSNVCQNSEKFLKFEEKYHLEDLEICDEQSSNALETSRKSSQSGSRKLRNKTARRFIENFGEFEENFDTKEENVEDFMAKSEQNSEKALSGSFKVKRKRGRPKKVSKVGSVDNNFCEPGRVSNVSYGKTLPTIDDLLRDVLENLTKSNAESVNNLSQLSADNFSKKSVENVENISKHFAESANNLSKTPVENLKNFPSTSAGNSENCVESIENAVAVKKKVGRPKRVGKNLEVRKLLEDASSDLFEEFDNCGVADVIRLEPVARRLRKRCRSAGNTSKYVESDEDDSENSLENSGGDSGNPLENRGRKLGNQLENSEKPLENIIVMLADGPKTTLDPQVLLLNEMMSRNKSKTIENRVSIRQPPATYCTNNLSEDGLRMIIKKEIKNNLENKNSSPEIYEEDIFEYGNVIHKVRYFIRKEKIKQEEITSDDNNNTNHEENVCDNEAEEIISNELIQAIKEEPSDHAEELLLENEGNETREYTINNIDQKDKLEEKPFAKQQETIRFRTRNRRGRKSYLIPKTVDISGFVNRCKLTTVDNKIDKKYDKNIHNGGNYTMEIKSEIAENNKSIDNVSHLIGGAKRSRRSRRVTKRIGRRVRVSDRILDGSKMSKNKVEHSVDALNSSEYCENSNFALENHVESVRNSTDKVESVRNSTDNVESVRSSTDKVESVRNSTDKVGIVRNSTDKVGSVRNSTDNVESVRNGTDKVESVRNSTDKVGSVRNSTDNVESVRNSTDNVGSVRNSTDNVESVRNSTDNVESVRNSTVDAESDKNSINNTGNVESSLNYVENVKNSTVASGNVKNSTVTTSTGSNKILVKSLASLMDNFGSNPSKNEANSAGPSKLPSNRKLVRNLANLVSKLDSITKKNVKNVQETIGKADMNNDNGIVENNMNSNLNNEISKSLDTIDSNEDDSEGIVPRSLDSNSHNSVHGTLDSDSGRNLNKTGSTLTPNVDVSNMSATGNSSWENNMKKSFRNDKVGTANIGMSLRKRKAIINYDDNFYKIFYNYDISQNSIYCDEKVGNLTNLVCSSPDLATSNRINVKSDTKIFSIKTKLFSKNNSTYKLRVVCDSTNDKVVQNVTNTRNNIETSVNIVNNLENCAISTGESQLQPNNIVRNHTTNLSSTPEPNSNDNFETECSSPVKLEANTVPIDTVSNGGRLLDTVSNIDCNPVSNIESNTVSNRLHSVSDRGINSDTVSNTVSNRPHSVSNRGLNFDTVSNTDPNIASNTVSNRLVSVSERGLNLDTVSNTDPNIASNTVSNRLHSVSERGLNLDTVSNTDPNIVSNRLHSVSNRGLNSDTVSNTDPNIASNTVSNRLVSVSERGLNFDTVSNTDPNIASNTVSNRLHSVSERGLNFDTVSTSDPNIESDYEEKYSAVLKTNSLNMADDEFMKTIESFLDEEVQNSSEAVGKSVMKKRRRPCELPAIPESLKCETCGKVLKNRQSFEYHIKTHTDPRKQWVKCSCCNKLLAGERRLKSHMYNFHTLVKTFSCDRCKKIFHSRGNLYKHIVNVHLEPETYTCDICKKSFKRKSYLAHHINMHMGIRAHECNLCGKNFMHRSDLQNHLDAHVGFDRYVCGVCGKRMISMQTMHVHMKHHTHENMFRCQCCAKEYATKSSLKEHMNVHTGKKYTCETCGAQFPYRNGYKRHLATHDGKQQECDICHKVFQRKYYLKKHMSTHMGTEQFMCVYCGKKFIEKSDYNIHVNRHTHAQKFPCEFCGKVFHNKGYLVDHRKMHTGDTKHVCKYCGKKFMKRGLLERHESIHEGTNFVECEICGAMLSSVNSCRRHLRGVHGVVL